MSDEDYAAVRHALSALSEDRVYFAFCPDDDTFIWHKGRGPWNRDDDGSHFLRMVAGHSSDKHAVLAQRYFKDWCLTAHIDTELKMKRLNKAARGKGETS